MSEELAQVWVQRKQAAAYNRNPRSIPLLRGKVERILATWPEGQQPKMHFSCPRTELREQVRVDKKTKKKTTVHVAPVFTGADPDGAVWTVFRVA